jgi:hypothetical protein
VKESPPVAGSAAASRGAALGRLARGPGDGFGGAPCAAGASAAQVGPGIPSRPLSTSSPSPRAAAAARLLEALCALPVEIADARAERRDVHLDSYPGGLRPSSAVLLAGGGDTGHGEHVGWTADAHDRFAERVAAAPLRGRHVLGALSDALREIFAEPYDRAAIEAAAVDLALRQSGAGLGDLARVAPRPVRYVVSFDSAGDPVARMRAERRRRATVEFKLDVDPRWGDAVLDGVASEGGVAVLDFKGAGEAADHERFARRFPSALLEDALASRTIAAPAMRARLSLDGPIVSADALAGIDPAPAAVNVKPARMGGVLEAIAVVAAAARRGSSIYFGGMFEVGVARLQLRALASVLAPDGTNDIAPLVSPERPDRLDVRSEEGGFPTGAELRTA